VAPQFFPKSIAVATSELQDTLSMIRTSCNAYDSGEKYEAARLAGSIFNIFHDANTRDMFVPRRSNTYRCNRQIILIRL
jgi:hypothetical protein